MEARSWSFLEAGPGVARVTPADIPLERMSLPYLTAGGGWGVCGRRRQLVSSSLAVSDTGQWEGIYVWQGYA